MRCSMLLIAALVGCDAPPVQAPARSVERDTVTPPAPAALRRGVASIGLPVPLAGGVAYDTVRQNGYTVVHTYDVLWKLTSSDTIARPPAGGAPPFGLAQHLASELEVGGVAYAQEGFKPQDACAELALLRSRGLRALLNLTGGSHANYVSKMPNPMTTNPRDSMIAFDMAKWRARIDQFTVDPQRTCLREAVASGLVVGANVMDEPHQDSLLTPKEPGKWWGPPGWMTKAKVDTLCAVTKSLATGLLAGVGHNHPNFEPTKNYAVCDFIIDAYRIGRAGIATGLKPDTATIRKDAEKFRDDGLAFGRRSGIAILFSMNVLDGGPPGNCPKDARPCEMTASQFRQVGLIFTAGCATQAWKSDEDYFAALDVRASVRAISDSLVKRPATLCRRPI
jgi:hypothetical protein